MADAEPTPINEQSPNGGEDKRELQQLQDLYDLMRVEGLESLELEDANGKIRVQRARRGGPAPHESHGHRPSVQSSDPSPRPSAGSAESLPDSQVIATPLAGVFYRSSSPTNPPYVQEGSVVELGQTLCIVEAMKVMNEIKAESRCRITKIMAENSRPVTAGQTLFQVEPA